MLQPKGVVVIGLDDIGLLYGDFQIIEEHHIRAVTLIGQVDIDISGMLCNHIIDIELFLCPVC